MSSALPELLQEPYVSLEEELQVFHTVFQQSDAVGAHAEGEAGNFLGIVAVVSYEFEHVGIDHAAAQDFDPSCLLAGSAGNIIAATSSTAAADETAHEHFCAWFGEREERRTETRLHARSEKFLHGVVERALQIAERNVGVDRQTLDLMEHGRMAGVRRVVAVNRARNHNADR